MGRILTVKLKVGNFLAVLFFFYYILLIMLLQLSRCFPLCTSPHSPLHDLRLSPHHWSCPQVMCISSLAPPFPILYVTSHDCSVITYLYFLIPSPLHPFSPTLLPSGNNQNVLRIHDSVSVILVCLVCFLYLIVDMYVFAILFFIVLIFFFLNKSL